MGSSEEAIKYIDRGYYIGLTGYLCKVSEQVCGGLCGRGQDTFLRKSFVSAYTKHLLRRLLL